MGRLCLVALLAVAGCAKPSEEWLAGAESPALAVDAAVAPDAGPALPTLTRASAVALPTVLEPRGLAVEGDRGWTTDRADDHLVAFTLGDGAELGRWPLPRRMRPALVRWDGALWLGDADGVLRFDGEGFEAVDVAVDRLAGLAVDGDGLVSAEDGALFRRDGARLAPRLELRLTEAAGPLVRWGDAYLLAADSERPDGVVFAAQAWVLDATSASSAPTLGALRLPVDAARISGLAADDGAVFVLGGAYGEDAGRVVRLEGTP